MATRKREEYKDDYMADIRYKDVPSGDFIAAKYDEADRNDKIADGYGGGYKPTYNFNYNNKWQGKIDKKRTQLENYKPFDYDFKEDDNYTELANLYSKNARDTAKNAIAQAAAINGGRAGTNAVIAASLGYGQKMSELEGEIPELRQLAYNMYNQEKADIRDSMNDYMNQETVDYGRFTDNYNRMYQNARDLIGDKQTDRDYGLREKQHEDSLALDTRRVDLDYNTADWNKDVTRRNQALEQSLATGYVNKELAEITGVPEGTPTLDAVVNLNNQQITLADLLGYVSPELASKYGLNYSGNTKDIRTAKNVNGGINYGGGNNQGGSNSGSSEVSYSPKETDNSAANDYAQQVMASIDKYEDPIDAINAIVPEEYRQEVKKLIAEM